MNVAAVEQAYPNMAFVHNRSRGGRGGVWGDTSGTLPRYKTTQHQQQPTAAAAGTVAVGDCTLSLSRLSIYSTHP